MSVVWKKKEYQPERVIEKIEASKRPASDGENVEFAGFNFHEFDAVIYSMLDFLNEIPEIDSRRLVSRAIFNSGKKGVITKDGLIAEINRQEREYQSLPVEKYVFVSSISLSTTWEIKKIKIANTLIIFENLLPSKFQKGAKPLLETAEYSLLPNRPANYLSVRVYVSAKSIHHAADQALEILDFTRGIWNWLINKYASRQSWGGGKHAPVNKIILGPIHTLHKPNGKLATSGASWYEPNYLGEIKLYSPRQDQIEDISKAFIYVKKIFKKHKYPAVIQNAFVRYTRALDDREWETAFLKLWSVLELLTNTGKDGYETTINRTAFLYKDREYAYQVLQHLKNYRNSSVHLGKGNSEMETYLYQLKSFIDALLDFHLKNKYGFETIQEAGEFLSLPFEEEVLNNEEKNFIKKIKKHNLAKKFHGYT